MNLETMYLYYDKSGNIKSISPDPQDLSDEYTSVMFPLKEVEDFLLGKKNPFDFYIKPTKRVIGNEYKITRKHIVEANLAKTLDNYLTEVPTLPRSSDANILIQNFVDKKEIHVSLSVVLKVLRNEGNDEQQESVAAFFNAPVSSLFVTAKGNPYHLLHTITFSPNTLFEQEILVFKYNTDLSSSSVFTKKLISGYSYTIKRR